MQYMVYSLAPIDLLQAAGNLIVCRITWPAAKALTRLPGGYATCDILYIETYVVSHKGRELLPPSLYATHDVSFIHKRHVAYRGHCLWLWFVRSDWGCGKGVILRLQCGLYGLHEGAQN
jgi:hypothetical protein